MGLAFIQIFMEIRTFGHLWCMKQLPKLNLQKNKDNSNMLHRNAPGADRLFRIRPIVAKLNVHIFISIDEQICSTKARNTMKSDPKRNPKSPINGIQNMCALWSHWVHSQIRNRIWSWKYCSPWTVGLSYFVWCSYEKCTWYLKVTKQ